VAEEPRQIVNQRLVQALGHPMRAEILKLLIGETELSTSRIARRLGAKDSSVSYHLAVLQQCETIELARTEQLGGGLERFFHPIPGSFVGNRNWGEIPVPVQGDISSAVFRGFLGRTGDFEPRGRG